jgi:hypothetical protein
MVDAAVSEQMKQAATFLGKPCKRDHLSAGTLRYLSNGHCVECTQLQPQMTRDQRRDYMRNWRTIKGRMAEARRQASIPKATPRPS